MDRGLKRRVGAIVYRWDKDKGPTSSMLTRSFCTIIYLMDSTALRLSTKVYKKSTAMTAAIQLTSSPR